MSEASAGQRLASLEQAVGKALELLERGAIDEARDQLALALGDPAFGGGISDRELEQAFDGARPETEGMLDADAVAQAAIRQADRALEEERSREMEGVTPRFATATMADLLERQGDASGAGRIRQELAGRAPAARPPARAGGAGTTGRRSRTAVLSTLERWLENLRGGARA